MRRGREPYPDPVVERATWQLPEPEGPVAARYAQGPMSDGSGHQDSLIEVAENRSPGAIPFRVKQLDPDVAGTVHGRMHSHPYPELIGWFSTDLDEQMRLGGTVTVYIGDELEQHSFDAPTLVYIPPGVPHGVAVYGKDVSRHLHLVHVHPEGTRAGEVTERPDLDAALPDFAVVEPDKSGNPEGGEPPWNPAGGGAYGKYLFSGKRPDSVRTLPATQLRLLPGEIPDLPIEKSFLFIYTWEDPSRLSDVPMHITHSHGFTEYLVCFSTDVEQPHDLGTKVRIYAFDPVSKKLVRNVFAKPFASVSQKGTDLHGPMQRKDMTRHLAFMWCGFDYDPDVFEHGPEYGVALQLHNEYYTDGRFNLSDRGVADDDLPDHAEGDGGYLSALEPHLNWPIPKGHNDVWAPRLRIPPKPYVPSPSWVELTGPGIPLPAGSDVSGRWDARLQLTPWDPEDAELTLRTAGSALEGEIAFGALVLPLRDGESEDDRVTFRFDLPEDVAGRDDVPRHSGPHMRVRAWLVDGILQGVAAPFDLGGPRSAWPTTFAARLREPSTTGVGRPSS